MSIITISHEAYGDGRAVAARVAAILSYRCISREVLVKASQRYGIAEAKFAAVLEEKPQHWWTEWLESRGVYTIVLQAAYANWRRTATWFTTGAPARNFYLAFVMR